MEELKANLIRTREALIKEIVGLDDTEFNYRVDFNRWSIAQVCHH
ncbi:hypothetical protein PCURB6_05390 [Paenibacillus curdlanolyticus]|nr:hypothetical protein PCURB6_05390 [Paenibacillus curdlanolyticus]